MPSDKRTVIVQFPAKGRHLPEHVAFTMDPLWRRISASREIQVLLEAVYRNNSFGTSLQGCLNQERVHALCMR